MATNMNDIVMREDEKSEDIVNKLSSKQEMLNNLECPNLTFQMHEEDHTLGNVIRHLAMLNPYTTFAGYAIPHPSIFSMNLRIETVSNVETEDSNRVLDLRQNVNCSSGKKKYKEELISNKRIGATQILLKSCDDLEKICDMIENKFDKAVESFYSDKS